MTPDNSSGIVSFTKLSNTRVQANEKTDYSKKTKANITLVPVRTDFTLIQLSGVSKPKQKKHKHTHNYTASLISTGN